MSDEDFLKSDTDIVKDNSAVSYILQCFKHCNIIGLGEGGHQLENSHQFFHKLLEVDKIQETVDFIILEFANASQQNFLDKYISGLEIDNNELRNIWRESTQSPGLFGESKIYFDLLKKIRDINFNLPKNKKIRVLGGDPPINWNLINNLEDWKKQVGNARNAFPAELAIEYGIKQNKKVLIIYSESYLTKIYDKKLGNHLTITSIVNNLYANSMKVIGIIYSKALLMKAQFKNTQLYSTVDLVTNELGDDKASDFFQTSLYKDGKEVSLFDGYKLKDLFDALIYVGSYDSLQRYPMPTVGEFDKNSLHELNRRRQIFGWQSLKKK